MPLTTLGTLATILPLLTTLGTGDPDPPPAPWTGMFIDLPLVDAPYSTGHGGSFPSMAQALWISTDFYQAAHFGFIAWLDPPRGNHPALARLATAAFDVLTQALPLAMAWQHEEWHRAVLGQYGIGSYNGVYHMDIFSNLISVDHVRDEDLVWLKANHPTDQVRLQTAGIEGTTQLAVNIERVGFFHDTATWDPLVLWLLAVTNTAYMAECSWPDSDTETAKANAADGTSIPKRDFTGLDCDGWTYDLFRPNEPYDARGVHPSGVGIDRYRSYSDLLPAEQNYLRNQAWLSVLNFVDPTLFGFRRFSLSDSAGVPLAFNLAVRHLPTAFGYDVRLDLMAQRRSLNLAASLHLYGNQDHVFYGAEAEVLRYPFGHLLLSTRLAAWLQPDGLRFAATTGTLGGLASLRLTYARWPAVQPYVEGQLKSEGWVAGEVFLGRHWNARAGVSASLGR